MNRAQEDTFWGEQKEDSLQIISLNELGDELNVSQLTAEASCLGRAVSLAPDAIQLVITGFVKEAREYFPAIRKLALVAYEHNDRYIYEDPDGRNDFGRYMAMRLAAFADWAINGNEHVQMLEHAVEHLLMASSESNIREEVQIGGTVTLHLCQLEKWERASAVGSFINSKRAGGWAGLARALKRLSEERESNEGAEGVPCTLLRKWFLAHTAGARPHRLYHPRFTALDIAAVADVWGRTCLSLSDPIDILRTIGRYPV